MKIHKRKNFALKVTLLAAVAVYQLFAVYGISATIQPNYIHPNQQPMKSNTCIPLRLCSPYLWMLQNKHKIPLLSFGKVFEYLKARQCGFDGNDPKVVCPTADVDKYGDTPSRSVIR